jgi:hypothetical protein
MRGWRKHAEALAWLFDARQASVIHPIRDLRVSESIECFGRTLTRACTSQFGGCLWRCLTVYGRRVFVWG